MAAAPFSPEMVMILQLGRRSLSYVDRRLGVMAASLPINPSEIAALAHTTPGMQIFINEARFMEKTEGKSTADKAVIAAFLIFHEYLHHVLRYWVRLFRGGYNPQSFNIAQDLVINQLGAQVFGAGFDQLILTLGAVLPVTFGFPEGLSSEEYYRLLQQEADKNGGQLADGELGSCAQPEGSEGEEQGDPAEDKTRMEKERLVGEGQDLVEKLAEKAKGRGYTPAGIGLDIKLVDLRQQIDWRQELSELLGFSLNSIPGSTHNNWAMASRRQAAVGWGIGSPCIPSMHSYSPRVAVVLDTSGSMQGWIAEAVTHIWHLVEHCRHVRFIACDADVHHDSGVQTLEQLLASVKGGGGTNMTPAFDHLDSNEDPPDVVICVTDGEIGDPGPEPDWETIWICNDKDFRPRWGRVIHCKEDTDHEHQH